MPTERLISISSIVQPSRWNADAWPPITGPAAAKAARHAGDGHGMGDAVGARDRDVIGGRMHRGGGIHLRVEGADLGDVVGRADGADLGQPELAHRIEEAGRHLEARAVDHLRTRGDRRRRADRQDLAVGDDHRAVVDDRARDGHDAGALDRVRPRRALGAGGRARGQREQRRGRRRHVQPCRDADSRPHRFSSLPGVVSAFGVVSGAVGRAGVLPAFSLSFSACFCRARTSRCCRSFSRSK